LQDACLAVERRTREFFKKIRQLVEKLIKKIFAYSFISGKNNLQYTYVAARARITRPYYNSIWRKLFHGHNIRNA
jgi:hypothetical protein